LDLDDKLQTCSKLNDSIRRKFGKQITKETKLRIHNITAKVVLKFHCEAWMLKKRDEHILDAPQMTFLIHLLGITQLYRERNQSVRDKLSMQNIVWDLQQNQQSGNNTYKEWTQSVNPSIYLRGKAI
jgi:hypothetical protein